MDLHTYLTQKTTQTELAGKLGLTQGAISQWLRKRVPADRVLAIERATGGLVTRHELRPDLYPIEKAPKKSKRH